MNAKLILANGMVIEGNFFGEHKDTYGELVFNTSVVGYQEIISDPSYKGQTVLMTYPWIGNYGINSKDFESSDIHINGFVVREYNNKFSNYQAEKSLDALFKNKGITGIKDVDTRHLVRIIREFGAMNSLITSIDTKVTPELIKTIKNWVFPRDVIAQVSTKSPVIYNESGSKTVVALDCGMKQNIVNELVKRDIKLIRVPFNTPSEKIMSFKPDGLFVSNGPGDPDWVPETVNTIKELHGKLPMFGICMGCQLISQSYGAKTKKLKFGHRGGNHPVIDLATKKVTITTQNHSFMVDKNTIKHPLKLSRVNVIDNTTEGVECLKDKVFAVQYHPESCPGPEDSKYLFDKFVKNIGGSNA